MKKCFKCGKEISWGDTVKCNCCNEFYCPPCATQGFDVYVDMDIEPCDGENEMAYEIDECVDCWDNWNR